MKLTLRSLLLAAALVTAAHAAPAGEDDALYRALGGQAGLARLAGDFVPRLAADRRIASFFKDTNLKELEKQLADQFCQVAGGPCRYEGETMKNAHADLGVRKADFNALVEVLQQAMDAQGIAFAVQNRLLARLAPMHRDIVTTP